MNFRAPTDNPLRPRLTMTTPPVKFVVEVPWTESAVV